MARLGSWIEPFPEGIYVRPADAWIDPSQRKERALVTHGHADHARGGHSRVWATPETLAIMGVRYGDQNGVPMAYGESVRIGEVENVAMADEELTIADLKARIAKTIAFLQTVPRETFDDKEGAVVEIRTPNRTLVFNGRDYVLDFAIPNFFFHVTTAYALLRKEGVPVGKMDYLGSIETKPNE